MAGDQSSPNPVGGAGPRRDEAKPLRKPDAGSDGRPPGLSRHSLSLRIRRLQPSFPLELVQAGLREIIDGLAGALAEGRPVILRGFGRFTPRRYRGRTKKLGLIFRPAPRLLARLNRPGPAPEKS